MVEPRGIAPRSSLLITCAFIAIVKANSDRCNIGIYLKKERWKRINASSTEKKQVKSKNHAF